MPQALIHRISIDTLIIVRLVIHLKFCFDRSNRKAQVYYIKDLCMNTRRFDSWAGLTVIEFAKIEEFITVSC